MIESIRPNYPLQQTGHANNGVSGFNASSRVSRLQSLVFGRRPMQRRRMERIVWGGLAIAGIGAGVCMVVWPAWTALKSRDEDDGRPPNVFEIWFMRVVGVA